MQHKKTPALRLKNVTKSYGNERGIKDVTFSVTQGEVFGFLGPNGAGKSTTVNAILDILRLDTGSISIFGKNHQTYAPSLHQRIGYLSGDMETDTSLTGEQYLDFVAHAHGGVDKATTDQLVKRLKCETDKRIKHLSRGNKQKIGLVAALMHDPDLLILDEPTSGLDPLMQNEFNKIIHEHSAKGKTTFISSHVLSEVQAICDRVGFIKGGELIKVSSLDELLGAATKEVTVLFAKTVPKNSLVNLPGAKNLTVHGQAVHFHFKGDNNVLLRLLSAHQLKNVQISEPDLSDLFMDYYQEAGDVS